MAPAAKARQPTPLPPRRAARETVPHTKRHIILIFHLFIMTVVTFRFQTFHGVFKFSIFQVLFYQSFTMFGGFLLILVAFSESLALSASIPLFLRHKIHPWGRFWAKAKFRKQLENLSEKRLVLFLLIICSFLVEGRLSVSFVWYLLPPPSGGHQLLLEIRTGAKGKRPNPRIQVLENP